ncbi:uncharacterized protein N7506_007501 [Penicillium brevicompactum]|uniref:uncharacterized protein n=1 Tax=Penicillium brevicompactum TaxID=5074 RepID=UPI002541793D|nr:uncharacterized protein N7506_007501 [Penicillium brevicompactum]KAJ5333718.1 hypothetical protein N7506_007501 [Penicillium brevicompactum]
MSSFAKNQRDEVPEYVTRMEKVPPPFLPPRAAYGMDGRSKGPFHSALLTFTGLTRAVIAWMLDINVRASVKRREFERTWIRTCMYIKHCERKPTDRINSRPKADLWTGIMDLNGIPYTPYTNEAGGKLTSNSREGFRPHMASTMVTRGPILITGPVKDESEISRCVSDTQTMDFKLHELEIIRFMGRVDLETLTEFNESTRGDACNRS